MVQLTHYFVSYFTMKCPYLYNNAAECQNTQMYIHKKKVVSIHKNISVRC